MRPFPGLGLLPLALLVLTVGCVEQVAAPGTPADPGDPGAVSPDAPPGEEPGTEPKTPGEGPSTPAGTLDFGPEPQGAAAVSTLSCPVLAMPPAALKATVYVDANAKGAEVGTKVAPFHSLVKAFGAAGSQGVVWVAAGRYPEELLVPNKNLTVLGGFTADFGARTNACATTLDAPNNYAPVFAVTTDVRSFTIEGLSISKGVRGLMVLGDSTKHSNITIARCVFSGNGSRNAIGGAVYLDNAHARIFGSVFRNNQATKGAAIAAGGDVSLVIDQNLVELNKGYSDHGGGLYLSASHSTIVRNTFRGNATGVDIRGGWGGAVIVYSNSLKQIAKADFAFNVFTENVAGIGGALFVDDGAVVTMSHDLLYRNRSYPENGMLRGAAIYVDGTGEPGGGSTFSAEYLTVANNANDDKGVPQAAGIGGNAYVEGDSKAKFSNSIFWNNGDNAFYVEAGDNELSIDNSVGASKCSSGSAEAIITAVPKNCKIGTGVFLPTAVYFGDEAANDYHEKSAAGRYAKGTWILDTVTSPAIDKADALAPVGAEPMPNGKRANLGAFSATSEASKSPF